MGVSPSLELLERGTLPPPRLIGRATRLVLGVACLYSVQQLVAFIGSIVYHPFDVVGQLSAMSLLALCIVNYVVNIGFGKDWGFWPALVAVASLVGVAGLSWALFGTANHPLLGAVYWLWLAYFYGHLGLSFVLASVLAVPGCEMRAIPELLGRVSGHPPMEHACPAAFMTKIDEWEAKL